MSVERLLLTTETLTVCLQISLQASTESVWQDLLKFDKDNHLMAAVCTQSNDESDSGLVHGHAYSVLKVVEIDGVKLVACRNPWEPMQNGMDPGVIGVLNGGATPALPKP